MTTGTEHTPGPWEILADPDDRSGWVVVDATHARFQVASVKPRFRPKEELANTRLIAAAPELLFALRACADRMAIAAARCEQLAINEPELLLAVDAIAKAEGQS